MACATLYVVSKILQGRRDLRNILFKSHKDIKIENVDCERIVESNICEVSDGSSDAEDVSVMKNKVAENTIMLSNVIIGADTVSETQSNVKKETDVKVELQTVKAYDPFCRNPLYAGATKEFNTELIALSRHFHPSVALFANQIIQGKILLLYIAQYLAMLINFYLQVNQLSTRAIRWRI